MKILFPIIIILFSIALIPAIDSAEALQASGTPLATINSNKVCGDKLCSEIGQAKPTPPEGQIVIPGEQETIAVDEQKTLDDEDLSLLFIQTAHSGTYFEKDGRNILTLVEVSPSTVWFTDRPHRVTGHELTEMFAANWGYGEDSFADDPPNAALDILDNDDNNDVFIVELTNAHYDPDAQILQYDVIILEEATDGLSHYSKDADMTIPQTFGPAVLFIDNADPSVVSSAGDDSTTETISIPGLSEFVAVDVTKGIGDEAPKIQLFDFEDISTNNVSLLGYNYAVPNALSYKQLDQQHTDVKVYDSLKSLSTSLTQSAGLGYSSPTIDAEVEETYSTDKTTSEESYYAIANSWVRLFELSSVQGTKASEDFESAVKKLPSNYDGDTQNEYFEFFSEHGTHYVNSVTYGGDMRYYYQDSDTTSTSTEQLSVSMSATVGALGGDVSADASVTTSRSETDSTKTISVNKDGIGGDTGLYDETSDGFSAWLKSVNETPGSIDTKYSEIYNLVGDHNKKTQIQNALTDYVRSDFQYQILLSFSETRLTTTVSIGTDSISTVETVYPSSSDTVEIFGQKVPVIVERGGLMVIADAETGEQVHSVKVNEGNVIAEFSNTIAEYEKKDNNFIYFVGLFTEFDSNDQSAFLQFQNIGATSFTELPIGENNFYMLVGASDLPEGYGLDKWLTAEDTSEEGFFANTNCEFSGSITKTTEGFTSLLNPTTDNCSIPDNQYVDSLDFYVSTSDVTWGGTDDTVTVTLGGLEFNLSGSGGKLERGNNDHYHEDVTGKKLEQFAIIDLKIHKSPDGYAGGWKLHGIKILADGKEIYNNQNINKWFEDSDSNRTWGPHPI